MNKFIFEDKNKKIEIGENDYAWYEIYLVDRNVWTLVGVNFDEKERCIRKKYLFTEDFSEKLPENIRLNKFLNWAYREPGRNLVKKIEVDNKLKKLDLIEEFIDLLRWGEC